MCNEDKPGVHRQLPGGVQYLPPSVPASVCPFVWLWDYLPEGGEVSRNFSIIFGT